MNNQFIIVTLRVTKRKCRVNVNHITDYLEHEDNEYRLIYLSRGQNKEVSETLEEIDELINHPVCISTNTNPKWDEERGYWEDNTIPK